MNDMIKVYAIKSGSTRKFVLPEPMKVKGIYREIDVSRSCSSSNFEVYRGPIVTDPCEDIWVDELAHEIVAIDGVQRFESYDVSSILITLQYDRKWRDTTTAPDRKVFMLQNAIERVLISRINRHCKTRYSTRSFPHTPTLVSSLYIPC